MKRYRNDEYHGCLYTSRKRSALIHRAQPNLVSQTKTHSDGTAFFEHIRLLEGFQPLITSNLNNSKGERDGAIYNSYSNSDICMPYTQALSETKKKNKCVHMIGEQEKIPEMTVR